MTDLTPQTARRVEVLRGQGFRITMSGEAGAASCDVHDAAGRHVATGRGESQEAAIVAALDALVDEAGRESFPASDAPDLGGGPGL